MKDADISRRWLAAMRRGDFESAWQQTDRIEIPRRRAQRSADFRRQPHHLVWNGKPLRGKDVLIKCDHGLGDSIQFLRYCPLVKQLARSVHVEVQPALLDLVDGMEGIDHLHNAWSTRAEPWRGIEVECMELAYVFRHALRTLPNTVPYLPAERLLKLRPPLGIEWPKQPKVGLVWASSDWNRERSLSPGDFAPLKVVRDVAFFSFQQGRPASEMESFSFPVIPISSLTKNIADAAVGLLSMDLLITVDCMMAHLAGALARPAWVLLKHEADWRWMEQRDDSPWYPTLRLFRQPRDGDWKTPVSQIASLLKELGI